MPRRSFLFGIASAVAASGLGTERSASAQPPNPQNRRIPLTRPQAPLAAALQLGDQCKSAWSDNTLTQGVLLTRGDVTYQRQVTYDRVTKSAILSIDIKQGGAPVVSGTATTQSNGASTSSISYGPAMQGVRSAALTSTNGHIFTGTVDGRSIRSTMTPNNVPEIEFLDHRPAPILQAPESLGTTVSALAKQASTKWKTCQTIVRTATTHGPIRVMDYKPGANGSGDPGEGWYTPGGTYNAPDCTNCWNNCVDLARDRSGIDSWVVYSNPITFGLAMASFNVISLACWGTCQLPGGGCCPVPCGGPFSCCGRNDNCFHGDICCPSNMVVCNNVCCGPNIHTCASDGTCGCPSGLLSCGEQCCQDDKICCGDQCCSGFDCQDNFCCTSPSHHCGNTCCPPFSSCCNGQCCSHTCVNNVCCPPAQVCGNVCCPTGQVCNNGTCFGCPSGPAYIRRVLCHSILANGTKVGNCCSPLAPTCCGGVCCGVGQNYCVLSNGQYVCTNVNPNPLN